MSGTTEDGRPPAMAGAPRRLRRACKVMGTVAAASWALGIAGTRWGNPDAHRLVLGVALASTTVAWGCWANGQREEDEWRALVELAARLAAREAPEEGPGSPSHRYLRPVV